MQAISPFELQRQYLRLQLQANRLLLTQSGFGADLNDDEAYPRSLTMRLLTSTPGIATFLLAEIVPFLLGRYLAKPKRGKVQQK
jgi:hypothetical protein